MIGFRLVPIFRSIVVGVLCLTGMLSIASSPAQALARPVSVENTLAFQLFRLEAEARTLPPEFEPRLRSVLTAMHASLGPNPRPPATPEEFADFARRTSIALASRNFVQPVNRGDWLDSLGEALTPIAAGHRGLASILDPPHSLNAERLRHAERQGQFYFLDCDMAALLLISTAQMVGFELQLVHAPDHEFVRWEDGRGNYRNWDWTYWGSFSNEEYRRMLHISRAQEQRGVHLSSRPAAETRGYFITGVARTVDDRAQSLALLRQAAALGANNPVTASNIAWSLATDRDGVSPEERRDALVYSLTAWAGFPDSPVSMNNVACALAVRSEWALAIAFQERAIERELPLGAASPRIDRLRAELARLESREPC